MYVASDGIHTVAILRDTDPSNPRDTFYQDNITKMICWHRRYQLGDRHSYEDVHDFAMDLVAKNVPQESLYAFIKDEKSDYIRLVNDGEDYGLEVKSEYSEEPIRLDIRLDKDLNPIGTDSSWMKEEVLESMSTNDLLILAQEHVAIRPLYLYDHSGLSISSSSFIGRAQHAEWDSCCVGFIYLDKETAIKELALPAGTLRICHVFPENLRKTITLKNVPNQSRGEILINNGFMPVAKEDITNLNDKAFWTDKSREGIDDALKNKCLYKKEHELYVLTAFDNDNSLLLKPVAVFNPDLCQLTNETWKERAMEVLDFDVKEYDAYLKGDVYGFRAFEGLDEKDSCWGFNFADKDIRQQLYYMTDCWASPELCAQMEHASYEYGEDFDIDDFFDNHDFPELRKSIVRELREFITTESTTMAIYPYGLSSEDLLANKDNVLDNIAESLYSQHKILSPADFSEAILSEVGPSRAVQPKISVSDLEPDKDYTASELMDLFKKKPSLSERIASAKIRRDMEESYEYSSDHVR